MLRSGKLSEEVSMNRIKYKSEGTIFETTGSAWTVLLAYLVRMLIKTNSDVFHLLTGVACMWLYRM